MPDVFEVGHYCTINNKPKGAKMIAKNKNSFGEVFVRSYFMLV